MTHISDFPKFMSSGFRKCSDCAVQGRKSDAHMDYIGWIDRGVRKKGKSKRGLAEALGGSPSRVTDILKNGRSLKVHEVAIIAEYLEEAPPPFTRSVYVPIIGKIVGEPIAGSVRLVPSKPKAEIAVPFGLNDPSAALSVEGEGMPGLAKDGWVVFCGERHEPPTPDQIGELCRCMLSTGDSVIRFMVESRYPGHFDLIGYGEEPLRAQKVLWAETVLHMSTRVGAETTIRQIGTAD